MSKKTRTFSIRINDNLMEKIISLAESEKRSVNMQIEMILEKFISDIEKNQSN